MFSYNVVPCIRLQPFQPTPASVPAPLAGWMSNPPAVTHPAVSGGPIALGTPSIPGIIVSLCFCFGSILLRNPMHDLGFHILF